MEILALVILAIFSIVGLIAIFFTTFGTLIILIGAIIYALMTGFSVLGLKALLVLAALYFFGELMEYICIILGAKRFGATNAAIVGALIGAIVGALLGTLLFGVGIILGTFFGIFMGAFLVEFLWQRDLIKSLKAGTGGILGRFGSIIAKLLIAGVMFAIIISNVISSIKQ